MPGDALGALFTDEQSTELVARHEVSQRGHQGGRRWCWEFVEGLTERQAAGAVRGRLDWNLRAGPCPGWPWLDASLLTESARGCSPMARLSGC
jgi:hypothetical protein